MTDFGRVRVLELNVKGTGTGRKMKIIGNKSEDDDGSRAVFDDVDCFRNQG